MRFVRLIHRRGKAGTERVERLRALGYDVDDEPFVGLSSLVRMAAAPPDVVVIELGHAPSQGRDVAIAIRERKATRRVPLVFADGDPVKVEAIRALLPDALYTRWEKIDRAVERAIARPPAHPVVPSSRLAGYAGTPLPKKLGIKAGLRVALIGAPGLIAATLGELPAGVELLGTADGADLVVWFVRSQAELREGIDAMAAREPSRGLWIAWPKRTSALAGDLGQRDVRAAGLAAGLVDHKVCSVDVTWSGLKFARRRDRT
jgi:hypothetical protein